MFVSCLFIDLSCIFCCLLPLEYKFQKRTSKLPSLQRSYMVDSLTLESMLSITNLHSLMVIVSDPIIASSNFTVNRILTLSTTHSLSISTWLLEHPFFSIPIYFPDYVLSRSLTVRIVMVFSFVLIIFLCLLYNHLSCLVLLDLSGMAHTSVTISDEIWHLFINKPW